MFDPVENMKKIYLGKTVMIYSSSFSTMFFGKVIDINPAGIVVEPNSELSGRSSSFVKESLPKGHASDHDGGDGPGARRRRTCVRHRLV